ncbi:MAG: oligosaccharide flippase family protein [Ignavibacteria bacterium]
MIDKVKDYFTIGHTRSLKTRKNIVASLVVRGLSISIGFLLVPLTLHSLGATRYGLWLTISSFIGWFSFFDIGLGNGLRNKLSEALAVEDYNLAKKYVSTTYISLIIVTVFFYLLFVTVNPFFNWIKFFNTQPSMAGEINTVVLLVFTFFSIQLILNLIGVILSSYQSPAISSGLSLIANTLSLTAIFIVTRLSYGNLLNISLIYSVAPVFVLFIATLYFFKQRYKLIRPDIRYVDFKFFKPLASLGIKFFILQIAFVIINATDNVIIAQVLGPADVTPYNIAFKYFNIPLTIFSIILAPFWSAFTDAFTQNEIPWIKSSIKKLIMIWLAVILGVVFLLIISKYVYRFWVGETVNIPFLLSAFMGLYVIIATWNSIFITFINGSGKVQVEIYYHIVAMLINIPLSVLFAKYLNMGSSGVILGTCVSLLPGFILAPLQYLKLINGRARGIWNR